MKLLSDTVTDGQRRRVMLLVGKVLDHLITEEILNRKDIERLIRNGDKFQAAIASLIKRYSVRNTYVDKDDQEDNYTYPEEYKGPKPIEEQIKVIAEIFGLNPSGALELAKNLPALPGKAEGWFAIPSVDALAKMYFRKVTDKVTDPASMYCCAAYLIYLIIYQKITEITNLRSFFTHFDGLITPNHLRVIARTARAMNLIAKMQKSDILIIAAQLGKLYPRKSVREARGCFGRNEFGLGIVPIGSILMTHPERLLRREELGIACAGDEFSPEADGNFWLAPCFYFGDDKVRLGAYPLNTARPCFGAASGFLPE